MGRTTRTTIGLLTLATLTVAACSPGDDDAAEDTADAVPAEEPAAEEFAVDDADLGGTADEPTGAAADAARTGSLGTTGIAVADFGRDVITEIELTMTTDDVAATADAVRRITVDNGGAVFSSEVTVGQPLEDGAVPGGGRMVVRIPPQDLDRLVADLDGLGGVTRIAQDSEDVTDQLVDLEIRIRQAQTGIQRIEEILARTTDLDDLFAIETELGRRQVELERLLAAQRSTEDRVALATVTIDIDFVHDAAPVAEPEPEDEGIADAFRSGWDLFVGALFAIGFVLALTAPFLAVGLLLAAIVLVVARHRRRNRTNRTTEPPSTARLATEDTAEETVSDRVGEPSPMV